MYGSTFLRVILLRPLHFVARLVGVWYGSVGYGKVWSIMDGELEKRVSFLKELEALINKHSMENRSNTPDFILANYLIHCLDLYSRTVNQRDSWWSKSSNRHV